MYKKSTNLPHCTNMKTSKSQGIENGFSSLLTRTISKQHGKNALKHDPERFPVGIWQVGENLAGRISRSLILIHFSAASLRRISRPPQRQHRNQIKE
jgi:hypothetical protein